MKKLSALLLALVLAATLCFGAMAEEISYVGTWTLTEIRSGELVMDPATLGMDMTIVLSEDGTCILNTMGMTEEGLWGQWPFSSALSVPFCSSGGLAGWPQGLRSLPGPEAAGKAQKASRLGQCLTLSLPAPHPPRALRDVISPALRGGGHPSSADNAES